MNSNSQCKGRQSLAFQKDVYIAGSSSIVGKKEGEGPFGTFFDQVVEDPLFGKDTWEEAESAFQAEAVSGIY